MIHIKVDSARVYKSLTRLEKEQLPFAMALSLTRLAKASQSAVRGKLPSRFTIRNTFVRRGIQFDKADKRTLTAIVGASNSVGKTGRGLDFMERQEEGGTKRPLIGRSIAIPTNAVKRSGSGIIRKAQRPTALLNKPGYFKGAVRGNNGIWQRVAKRGRADNSAHLVLLYRLKPTASVPVRWGFKRDVDESVQRNFDSIFRAAIAQAIRTAR